MLFRSSKKGKSHSDITIADYWGINQYFPEFDDDRGVSLVLLNTDKGSTIYEQISREQIETTYEQGYIGNPSIEHSVQLPKFRDYFWKKYNCIGLRAIEKTINKMKPSWVNQALKALKSHVRIILSERQIDYIKSKLHS